MAMQMTSSISLLLALSVLGACQSREREAARVEVGSRVTSAPGVDREAEEQAIRDLDKKWLEAAAAKDAAAVASFYSEDAVFMPQGEKPIQGREAIRAMFAESFGLSNFSLTFEPRTIEVSEAGDMAYDIGTYAVSFDGPEGRFEEQGKYLVVWTKVGGEWKAVADIGNSNAPPPSRSEGKPEQR